MNVTLPSIGLPPSGPARNGQQPHRRGPIARYRRLPWLARWGVPLLVLGVLVVIGAQLSRPAPTPGQGAASAPTAPPGNRLVAHGVVAPVSQARVGTLSGGVLLVLNVGVGDRVEAQRELGRVRGPADVEVLTAPFGGTVTGLLAHTGDTLTPGAGVVMVADLSRLQVETTDVDEFLIGHLRPGQTVTMQIEALDRRELSGRVRSVGLQPQTTPGGDQHYPVSIELGGAEPDLRPGMSVRVVLPQ